MFRFRVVYKSLQMSCRLMVLTEGSIFYKARTTFRLMPSYRRFVESAEISYVNNLNRVADS